MSVLKFKKKEEPKTHDKMNIIEKPVSLDSVVLAKKAVNESRDVSASLMVIVFVIPCFFLKSAINFPIFLFPPDTLSTHFSKLSLLY